MRIWDLPFELMCRQHLLGMHRELHGMWTVLTQGRKGYRNHPETQRWIGRLPALFDVHERIVAEMVRRGWHHQSPLTECPDGQSVQTILIDSVESQLRNIRDKKCQCRYEGVI